MGGREFEQYIPNSGNHSLSVQYSGDTYYAAATSPASTVTVTQAQPGFLTYGWGTPSATIGQTVNPTGSIFGSEGGAAPTGAMTFFDNGTPISGTVTYTGAAGSPPYSSTLTGTTSYTFTTPGTHNLTINYSGDTNHLPTTTPIPNTLFVGGPVTVSPSSTITVAGPGQSGSTTLTLTANQGFSGAVGLSCTPDPAAKESSCSFTSGGTTAATLQLNLTGPSTTVTFTVTTTAPHSLALNRSASPPGTAGIGLGALAMIFMMLGGRPRKYFSAVALASLLMILFACGGGSSVSGSGGGSNTDPGTSAGQYFFTVTCVTGTGSSALTLNTPVAVLLQ